MEERERLLYHVMGALHRAGAPLVFKGAVVVNAILHENGFCELRRETVDIDANWVDSPPTMDRLLATINYCLGSLSENYRAVERRRYTDTQSARISVIHTEDDAPATSIDIKIKSVKSSREYYYGEVVFRGVMVTEILADKISVLSGGKIFRRVKDLLDVYALSHCVEIRVADIIDTCEKEGRTLSFFNEFLDRKTDLEHAYNRLQRTRGKPAFEEIYSYMASFLRPFIERSSEDVVWNSLDRVWAKGDRHSKKRAADR
jgi:predicted nucleotidyltransferase component of viral defense system